MRKEANTPVRVLLVGSLPPPYGGIPTYVRDLSQADIPGVKLRVFNTAFPEAVAPFNRIGSLYLDSLRHNGLWVTAKMVVYVLWSYSRLARVILTWRPHIVQAFPSSDWGYWRNWLYLILAKALGCRTIFHLLNAIDLFYARVGVLQRWLLRQSFSTADVYIVQSDGLKSWLEQHCSRRCYGFLNGLHLDRIPARGPVPKDMRSLPGPVGVTIGPLGKHKGTPQIMEALKKLNGEGTPVGWLFIGRGDVEDYKRRAEALGLARQVVFTGPVDDDRKWSYLNNADFYCLPSDAEGQPISILEAMAVGLPVIATDVGSIPEIIADGETGLVIPVGDGDALSHAIWELARDAETRHGMGVAAKRYVQEHHDIRELHVRLGLVYRALGSCL